MWVAFGLGGNFPDSRRLLAAAARDLVARLGRPAVSPLYRAEPIGGPPQPDFWNAVVAGWTRQTPDELLDLARRLEREAGRERGGPRNAPRPLDVDVLLYGARRLGTRRLVVPHPRLARRRFVLEPLAVLAARRVVPGLGRTVASLLRAAPPARVTRAGPLL